jgi:hypothetical protein
MYRVLRRAEKSVASFIEKKTAQLLHQLQLSADDMEDSPVSSEYSSMLIIHTSTPYFFIIPEASLKRSSLQPSWIRACSRRGGSREYWDGDEGCCEGGERGEARTEERSRRGSTRAESRPIAGSFG